MPLADHSPLLATPAHHGSTVKAGALGVGGTCEAPQNLALATRQVLDIVRRFNVCPQQP